MHYTTQNYEMDGLKVVLTLFCTFLLLIWRYRFDTMASIMHQWFLNR